jgi:hypothetical protein
MNSVTHKPCSTDTPVCALGFLRALRFLRPAGFSLSRRQSPNLEGAPSFAPFAKGGFLRSSETISLLFFLNEAKP